MASLAVESAGRHLFAYIFAGARRAGRLLFSKNQVFKILATVATLIFINWHLNLPRLLNRNSERIPRSNST
jgi:hypothetical protein